VSLDSSGIPFVKASACGNDFLLIEYAQATGKISAEFMADFTRLICDRHNGIGADGVEWIYPRDSVDAEIRLINADGSDAEISGNGTRCVAAYLYQRQKKDHLSILTGAGLKTCVLIRQDGFEYEFEVEMGRSTVGAELAVTVDKEDVRGIPVSMGNPHYVVFVPRFAEDWQRRGAAIQGSAEFRHNINVELVVVDGRHDIQVRFFERGAGETQSSGTGSCAAAVASVSRGEADFPVRVHAQGGLQTVSQIGDSIYLRGSARLIGRGEFLFS
jgi:diaminopimelate epimerase